MAMEIIHCSRLIPAGEETLVSFQELSYIFRVDRSGMGYFDDHAVIREHLAKFFCFFQDLAEIRKRIVYFHADITPGSQNIGNLLHDFISCLILVPDIRVRIVDKQIIYDPWIAGQISDQIFNRLYFIRICRISRKDKFCRTSVSILII